jgi:hypothetical protein
LYFFGCSAKRFRLIVLFSGESNEGIDGLPFDYQASDRSDVLIIEEEIRGETEVERLERTLRFENLLALFGLIQYEEHKVSTKMSIRSLRAS